MSFRNPLARLLVLAALLAAPTALAQERETQEAKEEVLALLAWEDPASTSYDASSGEPMLVVGEVVLLPPPSEEPAHPDAAPAEPEEAREPSSKSSSLLPLGAEALLAPLPLGETLAGLATPDVGLSDLAQPLAPAAAAAGPAARSEPAAAALAAAAAEESALPLAASASVVALGSVAAVASAAASGAGFDWDRLRRFGLAAALYTRIAKDRLLDHGRRDALLTAVRAHPGATLCDLAELVDVPRNTATYHLNRLEREGLVTSARKGRARHYFVVGGDARKAQADAFAALRHDTGRALALAVGASPGLDQRALCEKLGLAPSLVHWHADRLLAGGVISKAREGRHVRYHPGPSYALVATYAAERARAAASDAPQAC